MIQLSTVPGRECGRCTACCEVLGVAEIGKPYYQQCEHCEPKKGCRVYPQRPDSCRQFTCGWLQGHLSRNMRPDTCGVLFTAATRDNDGFELYETRAGAFATELGNRCVEEAIELGCTPIMLFPYQSWVAINYEVQLPYANYGETTLSPTRVQCPVDKSNTLRLWPLKRGMCNAPSELGR